MDETRFRRPTDDVIAKLVDLALTSAGVRSPRSSWEWIETGSASIVVLADNAAVRVSRDPGSADDLVRSQALVDFLPHLPFDVPRSLGSSVHSDGLAAVATQRLAGTPHPPGTGDPAPLKVLLEKIHTVDPAPFAHRLAPRRAYAGGERWYEVMVQEVLPRLPVTTRQPAQHAIDALAALPNNDHLVFSHGDLAGGNVLWNGDRVTGVLDWDLASLDDPAEDIASLATWHGWELVETLATPEEQVRARIIGRTFPLQVVASAIIRGRPHDEVDRAIDRAITRFAGG